MHDNFGYLKANEPETARFRDSATTEIKWTVVHLISVLFRSPPLVKSHDVKKIVMHAGLPVRSRRHPFFGSSGSGVHESDPAVIR